MLGLRTVIYKVSDLPNAAEWYSQAFGTKPYFVKPYYIGFNIGGYELGLQPEEEKSTKGENVLCYWGVSEIAGSFEKFIELGATFYEQPQNVGGDIVVAAVKDPWENIIGLIYNPEFKLK